MHIYSSSLRSGKKQINRLIHDLTQENDSPSGGHPLGPIVAFQFLTRLLDCAFVPKVVMGQMCAIPLTILKTSNFLELFLVGGPQGRRHELD